MTPEERKARDLEKRHATTVDRGVADLALEVSRLREELKRVEAERDEARLNEKGELGMRLAAEAERDASIADVKRLREVAEGYERWEATLIETDAAWRDGLPRLTQELWDAWIELQSKRNTALGRWENIQKLREALAATEPKRSPSFADIPAPDPEADARIDELMLKQMRDEGEELRKEIARRVEPMRRGPWEPKR